MIIKARRVSKKLMVIGDFIFKFKIYIQFIRFKIIRRKAKKKKKIMMKELKLKCNDIMENNIRIQNRIRNRFKKERRRIKEDPSAFNQIEDCNNKSLKYHPADYVHKPLKVANIRMSETVGYDSEEFRKAVNNKLKKKKKNNFLPADISSIKDFYLTDSGSISQVLQRHRQNKS